MEKLLTIVIPAYNMEKYLHRCIDSIIVESVMDKVQVLIVNDGSKDRTSEIAHEYADKYPQYITVIDKVNGNYGSCMNAGLSLAQGKYFRTLDADDWYDSINYEKFVCELGKTDADLVLSQRVEHFEKSKKNIEFDKNVILESDLNASNELWKNTSILEQYQVQSISFKTEVIRLSGFSWSEKIFYTDTEFCYWPLKKVKTVRFSPYTVYQYDRARDGQSTASDAINKNFKSYEIIVNRLVDDFVHNSKPEFPTYDLQLRILKVNMIYQVYSSLIFNGNLHKKTIDELEKKIKLNPDLYALTSNIQNYRNFKYVEAYRNNKLKFILMRLDYLLRSNKLLRKLFGKPV